MKECLSFFLPELNVHLWLSSVLHRIDLSESLEAGVHGLWETAILQRAPGKQIPCHNLSLISTSPCLLRCVQLAILK